MLVVAKPDASNGSNIITNTADLIIITDLSSLGWGAECQGLAPQGQWSQTESQQHVNVLEMQAIDFAVRAKESDLQSYPHTDGQHHSYGPDQQDRSTRSAHLLQVCQGLWNVCLEGSNVLTAGHIPGTENVIGDFQSRQFQRGVWKVCGKHVSWTPSLW